MIKLKTAGVFIFCAMILIPEVTLAADVAVIDPTQPYEEDFLQEVRYIQIPWKFTVYEQPSFDAKVIARYDGQEVVVLELLDGGWALIKTHIGNYWTNVNENKKQIKFDFMAYDDYEAKTGIMKFAPQVVTVVEELPNDLIKIQVGTGYKYTSPNDYVASSIVNPYEAYSYDTMVEDMKELMRMYPDIITVEDIGFSVEGRPIKALHLGKGEKKVLMIGAHHAREYISATFLMKTIEEYAFDYSVGKPFRGYNVQDILNNTSIYYVPMLNPDGVNLVINGIDSVKDIEKVKSMAMRGNDYRIWKANVNGVDLNRQYPSFWYDNTLSQPGPASEGYKGSAPETEPEIKAIMEFSRKNHFELAMSWHTKGEVIYWNDIRSDGKIPNNRAILDKLVQLTGYHMIPLERDMSQFTSGFENWFREEFKRPSFCIELTPSNGSSLPHDNSNFDSLVWEEAAAAPIMFAGLY